MRRTYAIGDIHGRPDLLCQALAAIEWDAGSSGADIVCLGDYVDKGPDSRSVLEILMAGPRRSSDTLTCLLGNHEAMMLKAHANADSLKWWLFEGGSATLQSFEGFVPRRHLAWVASLPCVHVSSGRIFVHAGLMPGVPLEHQDERVMLWIRDAFLTAGKAFAHGPHIVHGHSAQHRWKSNPAEPELLTWRTNLDTGAYATGHLVVGVFEGEGGPPTRLISIYGPPGVHPISHGLRTEEIHTLTSPAEMT